VVVSVDEESLVGEVSVVYDGGVSLVTVVVVYAVSDDDVSDGDVSDGEVSDCSVSDGDV
jgi:hypothetical protein